MGVVALLTSGVLYFLLLGPRLCWKGGKEGAGHCVAPAPVVAPAAQAVVVEVLPLCGTCCSGLEGRDWVG